MKMALGGEHLRPLEGSNGYLPGRLHLYLGPQRILPNIVARRRSFITKKRKTLQATRDGKKSREEFRYFSYETLIMKEFFARYIEESIKQA